MHRDQRGNEQNPGRSTEPGAVRLAAASAWRDKLRDQPDRPPAGQRMRIHRHRRQEEVYLVLEGRLTVTIDGEETELGAGELMRVAPVVRRQLVNHGSRRAVLIARAPTASTRAGMRRRSRPGRSRPAPPADVPLPDDLASDELRSYVRVPAWELTAPAPSHGPVRYVAAVSRGPSRSEEEQHHPLRRASSYPFPAGADTQARMYNSLTPPGRPRHQRGPVR